MNSYKNSSLIEGLRRTMERVERTSGVEPDDPALVELKRILNRRVATLEHRLAMERVVGTSKNHRNDYETTQDSESSLMS
jgi:hypothetical protein